MYLRDGCRIGGEGWRILGRRMADGTVPLGEYDAVDPDLGQFDYLAVPNSVLGSSPEAGDCRGFVDSAPPR